MRRSTHHPRIKQLTPRPTPASPIHPPVLLPSCAVPPPYMRNTRAAAPPDFYPQNEGAAAQGRRWEGVGKEKERRRGGSRRGASRRYVLRETGE